MAVKSHLMANGIFSIEKAISLIIAPRGSDCETSYRKSCPENIFKALNLTFDTCYKIKWGHYIKWSLHLIISPSASRFENRLYEFMTYKCFPSKNYGLIWKNMNFALLNLITKFCRGGKFVL